MSGQPEYIEIKIYLKPKCGIFTLWKKIESILGTDDFEIEDIAGVLHLFENNQKNECLNHPAHQSSNETTQSSNETTMIRRQRRQRPSSRPSSRERRNHSK